MKFKSKLYASIGLIILLISISVVILMRMLDQSMINMQTVVNDLYARIDIASEVKYETANVGRVFREMMDDLSNKGSTTSENAWEESNLKMRQGIESLGEMDTQEQSKELMAKYEALHDTYQTTVQQMITMKKIDRRVEIQPELIDEVKLTRERMLQISNLLLGLQEQEMKNELLRSHETYNWAVTLIYIYLAITLSVGIGLILWIIRSLTKNLHHVTTVLESVNIHNIDKLPRIEVSTKDEIGSIAVAFNEMVTKLEEHSKLEKQLLEEAEEHSWIKTKIAEIATMYPEAKDIQMLAELLISKLVPMVGASFGIFYFKSTEGKQQVLKRMAA